VSLVRAIGLVDGRLDPSAGPLDPANAELIADAIGAAADDRARYLADPAFVDVPVERLLGSSLVPGDTTSVVVVDGDGNALAMNHSLASHGGSGVMSDGLGFLYNNCMAGFDVEPGRPNSIAPGKARWSAAAPAVAVGADGVRLAITGPGGSRAIGAVIQGALDALVFGLSALEAVSTPRLDAHDGLIDLEDRVPASVEAALVARGRRVNRTYESGFAALYAVARDRDGRLQAADDPRRTGAAIVGGVSR
jgi:gamma-glutamyltranspeptidase/glutathione hydrolase